MILLKSFENSLPALNPWRFLGFFFCFFLKGLIVAYFTLKSMMHFELIFMRYETWLKVYFFAHQCLVGPHHLKRLSFLSEVPFSSIGVGLFWVLSRCVCPSVHHTLLTRVGISKVLKRGRLIFTLFCCKIRRFIIILPISIKSLAVMIEELDQFGENQSLYLLCCLPSHEHGMSVDLNL